jgi:hypothetical protein
VNWFAYVNNDPVNWVDPLGLQCISASDNANKNSPKTGLGQIVSGAMEKLGGIFLNGINALGLGLTSNSAEIAKQSERLISEGNLKIAVGQSLLTGRTNTNGKDVIPIVGVGALPPNVQNAYNGYESVNWQGNYPGQPPRTAAGRTYDNLDEALPPTDTGGSPITYKEFDVNGKQPDAGRDAERLVKGSDGATYYTGDHYGDGEPTGLPSFIEIRN